MAKSPHALWTLWTLRSSQPIRSRSALWAGRAGRPLLALAQQQFDSGLLLVQLSIPMVLSSLVLLVDQRHPLGPEAVSASFYSAVRQHWHPGTRSASSSVSNPQTAVGSPF